MQDQQRDCAGAPCVSVVVAWLDQAAGSQTMQRIGWAQPEAIPARDGVPLQGDASFPQAVPGAIEMKARVLLRWSSRPHGEAPLWPLSDERYSACEGMRHPAADAVALVARGIYGAADEQRARQAGRQTGPDRRREAPGGPGGLSLVGGRTWRVPAARRPALDAARRVAPRHARVPLRCELAGEAALRGSSPRQEGSRAHPRAGARPRPQEQGSGRGDGAPGASKKVQEIWGDGDDSTRPPNET